MFVQIVLQRLRDACLQAGLKARLTSSEILRHYDPKLQPMIETDASDSVIAGVLSQRYADEQWRSVAYFSKTMGHAEFNRVPVHPE